MTIVAGVQAPSPEERALASDIKSHFDGLPQYYVTDVVVAKVNSSIVVKMAVLIDGKPKDCVWNFPQFVLSYAQRENTFKAIDRQLKKMIEQTRLKYS